MHRIVVIGASVTKGTQRKSVGGFKAQIEGYARINCFVSLVGHPHALDAALKLLLSGGMVVEGLDFCRHQRCHLFEFVWCTYTGQKLCTLKFYTVTLK
jgi:hypothetical protein